MVCRCEGRAGQPACRVHSHSEFSRLNEAQQALENACKLVPDYPAALYLLGEIERDEHHLRQSTDTLQKVVALELADSNAQYLLGRNLENQGRTPEAIRHWRLALETDPNNAKALYSLAQVLSKSQDPDDLEAQKALAILHTLQSRPASAN